MSMITLLDTKEIVRKSIDSLNGYGKTFSRIGIVPDDEIYKSAAGESNVVFVDMLRRIYRLQYNLMFVYYNQKTSDKVGKTPEVKKELGVKRVAEYYYQHQFLHNTAAVIDEIFEQKDALEELKGWGGAPGEKPYKAFLLYLEESIDVVHFLVEYGCLFAEQYVALHGKEYFGEDYDGDFEKFFCDKNNGHVFKEAVEKKMDEWIEHAVCREHKDYTESENAPIEDSEGFLSLIGEVRMLIRNFAFKDWKAYDENYFDGDKLRDLFVRSSDIIVTIFNMMSYNMVKYNIFCGRYVAEVFNLSDAERSNFIKYQYLGMLLNYFSKYLAYGCYVAKNWVNMQRQIEDPRYNPEHFGKIIGVEVH